MERETKQILEKAKRTPGLAQIFSDAENLIEDVGLDSREMMDFILEVEKRFELAFDFERLEFEYRGPISKFRIVRENRL